MTDETPPDDFALAAPTAPEPTDLALIARIVEAALLAATGPLTVAQLYDHPRLGSLAGFLDEMDPPVTVVPRDVTPTPASTQVAQVLLSIPLATLTGLQWLTWLAVANNVAAHFHPLPWLAPLNLI